MIFRPSLVFLSIAALVCGVASADEHLLGWSLGAETLPQGKFDGYEFLTARLKKGPEEGRYEAFDSETEIEYGVTDRFQIGASIEQNYFSTSTFNYDGDKLTDDGYRFGGIGLNGKYRLLSPYIDSFGLAYSQSFIYNRYDETAGIIEENFVVEPALLFQKNFLDNTLITTVNLSCDFGWGKRPAEAYDHELGLEARGGISYRFAPGWFVGFEARVRSEYPNFDLNNNEHYVIYAGPSLHYGTERWWATLAWAYQLYGHESEGQEVKGRAYAEQTQDMIRLKIGVNF